ncbi:MAG: hypothetical protein QXI09_02390 [Candidatus Aenigmatarchaeota archaeon]
MGMFDILKKKKSENLENIKIEDIKPPSLNLPKPTESLEIPKDKESENVEETELLLNKIKSLQLSFEMLNEKIDRIEKMIKEIYELAKK